MAEDFLALENSSDSSSSDRTSEPDRERIKHLLVGSPKVVTRTIQILHLRGYAEAGQWSSLQNAGSLGEAGDVVSVLIRHITTE